MCSFGGDYLHQLIYLFFFFRPHTMMTPSSSSRKAKSNTFPPKKSQKLLWKQNTIALDDTTYPPEPASIRLSLFHRHNFTHKQNTHRISPPDAQIRRRTEHTLTVQFFRGEITTIISFHRSQLFKFLSVL